ncbi:MAG: non-ribosomal peptide synthetase, partial [Tumebacillaceae bacterium]
MKNLTDRLSSLTPKQRALLEQKMKEKNLDSTKIPKKEAAIPRRGHNNPSPLSIDQERLWFFEQMNPGEPTYNVYGSLRMEGNTYPDALEYAINQVIERHEAWRTTFDVIDGKPMQTVHAEMPIKLLHVDLTSVPEDELEAAVTEASFNSIQIPFDLANGPLLRVALIKSRANLHTMVLTIHHMVTDRITFSIFFYEMMAHYSAYLKGVDANLPEPQIQYSDYTEWQRDYLSGDVKDKLVSYWKNQLAGSDFVLNLATDFPRPPVKSNKGARAFLHVRKEVVDKLKEIGKHAGASSFMTLMAAFKAFLHRYTGQEDLLVGTPFANRNRREMEGTIGYFLTGIVMRTQVAGDLSFIDLVNREKDVAYGAYSHQELPFGMLIDEVQPKRDASRNAIYQACFVYVDEPDDKVALPELELDFEMIDGETAKYDITLGLSEVEDGLTGFLEYSPTMFARETVERMAQHWLNLLDGIIADPSQKIADLPLLSQAEEEMMLVQWNDTAVELPEHYFAHQLFEAQADRTPDATAVVFEETTLTYRELDQRSNQLAHHLQKAGIGKGKRVGLLMDRSLELVVAMYGVLKAGGAYVPLDPNYPHDRLAFMVEEAQVAALLTQHHLGDTLSAHNAHVIALDSDWGQIAGESTERPTVELTGDDLAYVLFTSGSTGKPKGAMLPHRALGNQMLWYVNYFGMNADDRLLQKSPFSFDSSVWELHAPLISGGQLVMAVPGGHQDMRYLVEAVQKHQITIIKFVPALLHLFAEEPDLSNCTSLRTVVTGGEVLSIELQDRVLERLPNADLYNVYGPTEACINSNAYKCVRGVRPRYSVPIGRPVANVKLYVLDSHMHPVPIGVPGELYIGGQSVGLGYLNRPELTAERFIVNPFTGLTTDRLYKTGDLVRYLPDGNLEFIGRMD